MATEAPLPAARKNWRERSTLTVEEAGFVLGIGRSSAYYAARSGDIPTVRIGRRVLVPVTGLRRMLGEIAPNDLSPGGNRGSSESEDGDARAEDHS